MDNKQHPLLEAQNVEEFCAKLSALKKQHGPSWLARSLGISVSQLLYLLRNKTTLVTTIETMSKALAKETSGSEGDILVSLCGYFGKAVPRIKESQQVPLASPQKKSVGRPSCNDPHFLGGGFTTVTYSEEAEARDIEQIIEARKEPEKGLDDALEKYWWLSKTSGAEKIGLTLEEAEMFEAMNRLREIGKSDSQVGLIDLYLKRLDPAFLPRGPEVQKIIERYRWLQHREGRQWRHHRDRQPDITLEGKIRALGKTIEEMRCLFFEQVQVIASQKVAKIRQMHEKESCDEAYEGLNSCLRIIHNGWPALGTTPAEIYALVEGSVLTEARRHAEEILSANTSVSSRFSSYGKIVSINKKWNFSLESLGLTPRIVATVLLREAISDMTDRYPQILMPPSVLAEIESIIG